jgi:hypothetical protein
MWDMPKMLGQINYGLIPHFEALPYTKTITIVTFSCSAISKLFFQNVDFLRNYLFEILKITRGHKYENW